jgi:transcriptional regulator of acetoin/glycerol metabolism
MAAMRSEGALQMADLPSALQYHQVANGQAANGQAANGQAGSGLARFSDAVGWDRDLPQFALSPPSPVISLPQSERQTIGKALAATRGERTKAARLLGIGRTTLYRKMKEYGFD